MKSFKLLSVWLLVQIIVSCSDKKSELEYTSWSEDAEVRLSEIGDDTNVDTAQTDATVFDFENASTTVPSMSDSNIEAVFKPITAATISKPLVNSVATDNSLVCMGNSVSFDEVLEAKGDYHSLLLTVTGLPDGKTLSIDSFGFEYGTNNPLKFQMAAFSSVTGFSAGNEIFSSFSDNDKDLAISFFSADLSDAGFSNLSNGDTIEFRIYLCDTSTGSNTRQHIVDDITVATSIAP